MTTQTTQDVIQQAISRKRCVVIGYNGKLHLVSPVEIKQDHGNVLGRLVTDPEDNNYRTYKLTKIESVRVTDKFTG